MTPIAADPALQPLQAVPAELEDACYELTLFVSGASSSSSRAIRNVRTLCEAHLGDRYELSIVDVNQYPELACGRGVLATPTLLKDRPAPTRMLVGDLSDHDRVLIALAVHVADPAETRPVE